MNYKCFHLLTLRFTQSFDSAIIRGVGLHQVGIEPMLANDLAETVAHLGPAIIPVSRLRRLFRLRGGMPRFGKRSYFLHRADTDAIGLAQGSVNGAGFGNTHFSAANERRNIGRIGIAVAYESLTGTRPVDGRCERPA